MFYLLNKNESDLIKNRKTSIGKVTDFKYSVRGGGISYEFYVNGQLHKAHDPDDAGYPKYVRDVKAEKNRFYTVEYDSKNINNSKIILDKNSKSYKELLYSGVDISGKVFKQFFVSKEYVDLYIKYYFDNNDFEFRTRLHKDSLPCGSFDECKFSNINLRISNDFPELNDLYFKSHDRVNRRK